MGFIVFRDIKMNHSDQVSLGRTQSAAQSVDKWAALAALSDAAEEYGLTHRSLGVLKALMTFLPGREIAPGKAIVFPSNKTLCHRLNGMPESTLRRHLAQLVSAGIVNRHDSPNRKRYARFAGQGTLVFGFDLSALAHHWVQLQAAAAEARKRCDETALLRARAGLLRKHLLERDAASPLAEEARMMLRRKLGIEALSALVSRLEAALPTEELSAPDNQNERHIQYDLNIPSDLETDEVSERDEQEAADLGQVLHHCKEYQSYYPNPLRSWHELVTIAGRLAGMIGIKASVFMEACNTMGLKRASVTVLCIVERLSQIRNPAGYLRHLAQAARAGRFDVTALLSSVTPKIAQNSQKIVS